MLRSFGADIVSDGNTCTITPPETLHGQHIEVPGDISSAAFKVCPLIERGAQPLLTAAQKSLFLFFINGDTYLEKYLSISCLKPLIVQKIPDRKHPRNQNR